MPGHASATLICTRCYQNHVASTALAEQWTPIRYRKQTYFETLSVIGTMKQIKGIQRQQAMFNGLMSDRYQGIDSMASLIPTPRYEYGSNSLRWCDPRAGIESRVRFGRFTEGLADSQLQPSEMRRILALQKMWKKVDE